MAVDIRAEREKRGLTLEQLARIINISRAQMGFIETGVRGLTMKNAKSLGMFFGIPWKNFYD